MTRRTLAAVLAGVGFVAVLVYGTLGSQHVACSVTVAFEGREQSATASAENAEEAERQAVIAACGPIAAGMDASIRCGNTPPVQKDCNPV